MGNSLLKLQIIWSDEDLAYVEATGAGNGYAGSTSFYLALDGFSKLAEAIRGYPRSPSDERVIKLGDPDLNSCGYLEMHLLSGHSSGLASMHLKFLANTVHEAMLPASASFHLRFEPASLDAFVSNLCSMQVASGECVVFSIAT